MKKTNLSMFIIFLVCTGLSGCALKKKAEEKETFKPAEPVVLKIPKEDDGAIFQQHMNVGLFDDINAKTVGDLVTIVINENSNASSSANTSATKDNSVDLPSPKLAGDTVKKDGKEILNNELEGGRDFNGQGTSAQSSTFTASISVTVAKVLPNRNLVIRGEKLVNLNQSEEFIRFSGIIRPQDIRQDNTIDSTRVANLHVTYSGQGTISDANTMGALGRFFQGKTWPY